MIPEPWTFALAFVATPAAVLALGYVAVRLHERSSARRPGPAE
jgi:hypothetical protein